MQLERQLLHQSHIIQLLMMNMMGKNKSDDGESTGKGKRDGGEVKGGVRLMVERGREGGRIIIHNLR